VLWKESLCKTWRVFIFLKMHMLYNKKIMCEVMSKTLLFKKTTTLFSKKKPIVFQHVHFLSHCFETKNYHCSWGFFIYIKLGILSLCTEPWHCTRSSSFSWYFCLYWKAIWWIDYVYIYWHLIHTHLSTTFNITLNCSLILTHARKNNQYCRAKPQELLWQLKCHGKVHLEFTIESWL